MLVSVADRLRKLGYVVTHHFGKYEEADLTSYGAVAAMKNGPGPTVDVRTELHVPLINGRFAQMTTLGASAYRGSSDRWGRRALPRQRGMEPGARRALQARSGQQESAVAPFPGRNQLL